MSKLVIGKSPAKAKTIKKYLGKNYEVMASMGHVRDLPKSTLGVDVEHDFTPKYLNISKQSDTIKGLQAAAKKAGQKEKGRKHHQMVPVEDPAGGAAAVFHEKHPKRTPE